MIAGREAIRRGEAAFGNFVADLAREITLADAALFNGGGFRATIPAGDVTLKLSGRPLDPQRSYRVVMPDFLADGGDGYAMLKEMRGRVDTGRPISDMVIEAFRAGGPVGPRLDGRIVRR